MLEAPRQAPSDSPRASFNPSQKVSRKPTPLTDGHTEAGAVSRRGEEPPYLPSCRGPGSRVSALQDKGPGGVGEQDSPHPASAPAKPPACVPGPGMPLNGGGDAGGGEGPGGRVTLGKSPSFSVLLLPHLSRAAACSRPPRGMNRDTSNCRAVPLASPRKQSSALHLPDTLTTPWLPRESC